MTTPTPPAPQQPAQPAPDDEPDTRPETVRYLLVTWVVMIGAELLHQLFTIAMPLLDPSALFESAREASKTMPQAVTEGQVKLVAYASISIMALLSLMIVALLAVALRAVATQKKWANNARTLLMAFSVFFALRMLTVFLVNPAGMDVPTAVIGADGVLQIAAGVAAICALIFASQEDAKKWTAKETTDHNDLSTQ
nr:Uncharacterised protein [Streptococcus thermophilus]